LKLLLDTTYFLSAIGISVKNLPKDAPLQLIQRGHQVFMSDVSVFELAAKGGKHVALGRLAPERVTRGIRAIVYSDTVEIVPIHETTILLTAFKLRGILNDFIDCLLVSSAMNQCDTLITEDSDIQDLKKNRDFNELAASLNPKFKIQTLAENLQAQH